MHDKASPDSVLAQVSAFAVGLRYEQLPDEVAEKAKYFILDAVTNMVEGVDIPQVEILRRMIEASNGSATVIGSSFHADILDAIFYHVAAGSLTARNDHHVGANVHPGSVLVPAVLAIGEQLQASGKDVLLSIVIGYESMIRVGLTLKTGKHYPASPSLRASMLPAPIGIAYGLSKLYNLDMSSTAHAAALACNHICGLNQWRLEGTAEDVYQNAWDALNAIHCVRMARHGVCGALGNFEGEYGFLSLFEASQQASQAFQDMGSQYKLMEIKSKVIGACARVLTPCQLAQAFLDDRDFSLDELDHLVIRINRKCTSMSWYTNRSITCQSEAINSVPFAVAAVLAYGGINHVSWFPPYDISVFAWMERIDLVYDEISRCRLDPDGYLIEAYMKDGRRIEKTQLSYASLSYEGIYHRFLRVMSNRFDPQKAMKLAKMVLSMERIESMDAFIRQLATDSD